MTENASCHAGYFDALYETEDPFGYRSRWYETRKREILIATLPRSTFAHGWEIGCSNGELTAALATRCGHLLATDISARAVTLAADRNRDTPHVAVHQSRQPADWPDGKFDLIVMSEVGYYLGEEDLQRTLQKIPGSLTDQGVLVACHWLAPFEQGVFDGREVHRRIEDALRMHVAYRYEDADFLLAAWSVDPRTPAQLEGLK